MDYYEEFGVLRSATPDQIRQAYRSLARLLHPDQFQDPELNRLAEGQMKRINEIFAVLSDPRRRWEYDEPPRPPPPPVFERYREQAGWGAALFVAAAWICWSLLSPPVPPAQSVPAVVAAPASPPSTQPAPAPRPAASPQRASRIAGTVERKLEELHPEPDPPSQPIVEAPPPVTPAAVPLTAAVATPAQPPPKPKGFAGRWLYLRPSLPPLSKEFYPPDYIETVIFEEDGKLRGRYQARYVVADRAISPEVSFQFEGAAAGDSATLPWTGGGGARGQVQLRQVSQDSLEVKWFATDLGKQFGLASGTAVLVRRHEP